MSEQKNYPLNGVGQDAMLGELVRHYGWEILAEQIPIRCFTSYPTFESSKKFLRKTQWARERLEAFYLYKYKNLPRPSDEQHSLPPRDRVFDPELMTGEPAEIALGDPEFFDDPLSGPVFPSKKSVQDSKSKSKASAKRASKSDEDASATTASASRRSKQASDKTGVDVDPWAKWRK